MIIQHNISSLNAWRNTKINNGGAAKNLEKLSSGFKINRAADDAAGLAISEKMRGQIRGLAMGTRNVDKGISLVQTAEGALHEVHSILHRMRELSVQSSNGTFLDTDREQLELEFQAIKSEVARIAKSTHYNGIKLLDGTHARPTVAAEGVAGYAAAAAFSAMPIQPLSAPTPPAVGALAAATVDSLAQTVTITGGGTFDLSVYAGYTINVQTTAGVRLTQTAGGSLSDVSIVCAAGANLFLDNLNINSTQDANSLRFTGAGNTLNLIGANTVQSNRSGTSNNALINVGLGATLVVNEAGSGGTLNAGITMVSGTTDHVNSAVIGGNLNQSSGSITFAGGTINAVLDSASRTSNSAVIGGGDNGRATNITITGGTVNATSTTNGAGSTPSGAAIGGGRYGSGNITITGGAVNAQVNAISIVYGSAIGSGRANSTTHSTVNISGGNVYASINGSSNIRAATIGGGGSTNVDPNPVGVNLTISGGLVTVGNNGWIGSGLKWGGSFPGVAGTTGPVNITGGTLVMNHARIQNGVTNSAGQYLPGANAAQIYRVSVSASVIGFDFPPETLMKYAVNGTDTYKWLTDPLPYDDSMYLYVPNLNPGDRTAIDIYHDGKIYKGYAEIQTDHSAVWTMESIEDDPNPPDPTDPPVPPESGSTKDDGGLIIHWGANSNENVRVYIADMSDKALGIDNTSIRTREFSNAAISELENAIMLVSTERANLGAFQNRLEHILTNNGVAHENLTAAESVIRDVDMAKEMMAFTKNNILVQSAQAMLAQANQLPQGVMGLLR